MSGDVRASCKYGGAVTAHDDTELSFNALYVGGAGDVSVDLEDGQVLVFIGVLAGSILPVTGNRVNAATTATNIVWMNW